MVIIKKESEMEAYCNDCKEESIFKINIYQDYFYIDGKRQKECISCGRYEPLKSKSLSRKG